MVYDQLEGYSPVASSNGYFGRGETSIVTAVNIDFPFIDEEVHYVHLGVVSGHVKCCIPISVPVCHIYASFH
jgi:hypothetical protein